MQTEKWALVVDDDKSIRGIVGDILENDLGFHVISAENGEEAWSLLDRGQHDFSIIVSDKDMPNMGGIELLQRLFGDPREEISKIPFLIMTGATDEDLCKCLPDICANQAQFIRKPLSISNLIAVVKRASGS